MKKGIKYSFLTLAWLFGVIVFLLLLISLLIQTQPVKKQLARFSEKQAGKVLNGELSIGKIDGNFFNGLILENVLLTTQNDTLAYIDNFSATYNLWSLIHGEINIHSVKIDNPYFYLEQTNDSTWNVQNIVKSEPAEKDTTTGSGNLAVNLSKLSIVNGTIKTNAIDTIIPQRIENLNTNLSFFMGGAKQKITVDKFSLTTINPNFTLNDLNFKLEQDSGFIKLTDFYIQTAQNKLEGNVTYNPEPNRNGVSNIETSELKLNEFEYFIPSLKIQAKPLLKFDTQMNGDSMLIQLELKENEQLIAINVTSPNLADFLFSSTSGELIYQLNGKLENVRLGHWIGNPQLDYLLNGSLEVNGEGTSPENARVKVNANFNETIIEKKRLRKLLAQLEFNKGNLSGSISGDSEFGRFLVVSNIKNLLETPTYTAKISTSNLNLAQLTGNDSLSSNLNLTANLKGKGFEPKDLSVSGKVTFTDSRFSNLWLDTLFADATYQKENLNIRSLFLRSKTIDLRASGNYSLQAASDIQLAATFKSTEEFQNFIPLDNLNSSGKILASIQGTTDSLQLNTEITLNETQVEDIAFQQLNLNASGNLSKTDTIFSINGNLSNLAFLEHRVDSINFTTQGSLDSLHAKANFFNTELISGENKVLVDNFNINGNAQIIAEDTLFNMHALAKNITSDQQNLDSVSVNVDGTLDSMFVVAGIAGNEINTQIESGIVPGSQLKLIVTNWQINYKNQHWSLQQPPAVLKIDSLNYDINNFKMASGTGDSTQHILLQGNISRSGDEDFRFEVTNLNIKKLSDLFNIESNPAGFFDLSIDLKGTVKSPSIKGNYKLDNASFNNYRFTKFNGGFNLNDGQFTIKSLIVPQDSGKFDVTATLPVQLNLDTMGYHLDLKDSIDGSILFEKFPLTILQTLDIPGNIEGTLQGKVNLDGTIESPNPTGNLKLQNASVDIEEYGVDYKDVKLNLKFSDNQLIMDTFNIRSADGNLTGTGRIDFESDFYEGNVSQSQIKLNFNNFNPVNHPQFNMQVTGQTSFGGKKGNVAYDGDLKIPQAEIYLPAILGMVGKMSAPEIPKPILVREVERMDISVDSITIQPFATPKPDSLRFSYLDNFQGQLRIRIPKNTWIKNEDMRIEISGEMELKKNKEYFELFGSVDVVRGQYDLLGKTFKINEGSVSFQGGEEIQPILNISANYTFRNANRAQQNLSVQITGTPESPEVNFLLDGSSVSEGDALSYILFGKSMNELTLSEQENVSGNGNLAEKAAASILSSQLSSFLGNKLNVDYIEVKSNGTFDNASVVVGKYITNDLFVSYEQRFGEVNEKDMAKYEVKLEYELFRFLFFELNNSSNESGFDVIVKFDVK